MGGGAIQNSENQLGTNAGLQSAQASTLSSEGQGLFGTGSSLISTGQSQQAPLASFLQKIIGGDSVATSQAIAPAIANITQSTNANRENIFSNTAPGAGRDILLGENTRSQGTQVAGATNSTFLQAFPALAALGGQNISQGLGAIGAGTGLSGQGITSLQNSTNTTSNLLQNQKQDKAQLMSNITGLASLAGGIATGGLSTAATKAASGAAGAAPYGTYTGGGSYNVPQQPAGAFGEAGAE